MKLLVLVADYPNNDGKVTLTYVHTRNIFYKKNNFDVTVLNFSSREDYEKEGVKVITFKTFKKENQNDYDLLICHAPNLRNHYMFLKKYGKRFEKHLFFFHGHEVLMCSKVYSKPFDYIKSKRNYIKDIYDYIKLKIWHYYFIKTNKKNYYVFVSNWMKEEFIKWTKINPKILKGRSSITYNSVGEFFENNSFDANCDKTYDFVTIRNNLDGSKYSIDIVNKLAWNTPNKKFAIVGKGEFFNHYKKAPNVEWINNTMNHSQIIELLQKSKFALMPTRTDAQGLMMCEMAAFGIPLITSDIPVCHEVFDNFENVYFIDNDDEKLNLKDFNDSKCKSIKHTEYFKNKTVGQEIEIIKHVLNL